MTTHRTDDHSSEDADAPAGGEETAADQPTADNEVEEDMLKTLGPDDAPA